MCSCSGSCNCNSTTIPRGPQGTPGTNGANGISATVTAGNATVLPVGSNPTVTNTGTVNAAVFNFGIPTGATGSTGPQGINAFTTLTDDFVQPVIGGSITIYVVNNSWIAVSEIIYIGPGIGGTPAPGGFYQVVSKTSTDQVNIINLGWTIPGTTFATASQAVGTVGTIVTPSGTIGASADNAYVLDSQWGNYSDPGGSAALKTSILVPANTLSVDDDVLECQTVFKIDSPTLNSSRAFIIKVCDTNTTTGTTAIQFEIPMLELSDVITTVHIHYKIQRIPGQLNIPTRFRSKGECFVSDYGTSANLYTALIANSYVCTSIGALVLNNDSNWTNDQYITVIVNDEATPVVSVIHHEVKVIKKY